MPVFVVTARDFEGNPVFVRVVYAKDRNDSVGKALHEENKERSYDNKLLRSKLYYSIKTLVESVPEMGDPDIVGVSEGNLTNEVAV